MSIDYELTATEFIHEEYINANLMFLDIDGVFNNNGDSSRSLVNGMVNPINLEPFKHMLTVLQSFTDVKVVLSSSWRYYYDIEGCANLVNDRLMLPELHVIGKTPIHHTKEQKLDGSTITLEDIVNMPQTYSRGHEIQYVVDLLKPKKYVIIDDFYCCFLPSQLDHLVRTDTSVGFTYEHVDDVINKFR